MKKTRQNVLVLGATSAIAAEVAERYAARGARLHLVGRDPDKLAQVTRRCAEHEAARVTSERADFSELDANRSVVERALATLGHVDVALIAHGDIGDQLAGEAAFEAAEDTFRVNALSVISLVVPLANHFEERRRGRLGVITSVAGDRGRPRNYNYGAAKGALNLYLQGVRSRLYPSGAGVTTLKLGPTHSPMTVDHPKNAFFATVPRVASDIVSALDRGVNEVYVPWYWAWIMPVVRHTPEALFQKLRFLSGR